MRGTGPERARRVMSGIVVLIIGIVYISPLYLVLVNSVKTLGEYYVSISALPRDLSTAWENYVRAWQGLEYPREFMNSLFILVFSLAGLILISSMGAYKLCRTKGRLNTALFFLLLISMLVPFAGIMVPLIRVLAAFRLVPSLAGMIVWYWAGLAPPIVFLYMGYFKTVPVEIEESARIDGASGFITFFRIVFPLVRPMTLTVITLFALVIWNDFTGQLVILQSRSLYTLPLGMTLFYTSRGGATGMAVPDWPMIFAALTITVLPLIVLFLFLQKYVVSGISTGAVKG